MMRCAQWSFACLLATSASCSGRTLKGSDAGRGELPLKRWQAAARSQSVLSPQPSAGTTDSFCKEDGHWTLDWEDEFTGSKLDESTWSVVTSSGGTRQGAVAPVSGLDDTACRTAACRSSNVLVQDGKLRLLSERDSSNPTRFYTGAVTTKGKRTWLHNTSSYRLCIKAKLPSGGHGIWPALWMLPDNGISDRCLDEGEVDIMEMINSDGNVYNTYHWMSSWPEKKCADFNTYHKSDAHMARMPSGWDTHFHEYAIERSLTGITFAIDGHKVFKVDPHAEQHLTMSSSPFFLIMNTAIGGGWPGEPTALTALPATQEIDYVRVVRPSRQ